MEQTFEIQNKYVKYRMNSQHTWNKFSAYRIKTQSAPHNTCPGLDILVRQTTIDLYDSQSLVTSAMYKRKTLLSIL